MIIQYYYKPTVQLMHWNRALGRVFKKVCYKFYPNQTKIADFYPIYNAQTHTHRHSSLFFVDYKFKIINIATKFLFLLSNPLSFPCHFVLTPSLIPGHRH